MNHASPHPAPPSDRGSAFSLTAVIPLAAVIFLLVYAKAFLLPIIFAVFAALVLAPIASALERVHCPRIISAIVAAGTGVAVISFLAFFTVVNLESLIRDIPLYGDRLQADYATFSQTVHNLQFRVESRVETLFGGGRTSVRQLSGDQNGAPARALLTQAALFLASSLQSIVSSVTQLLAASILIVVLSGLMIYSRHSLSYRLISLSGERHIMLSSEALSDAAGRVSRYLAAQCVINASYGFASFVLFWLIDLPHAPVWALLLAVLRFVPYFGSLIGCVLIALIALASSGSWRYSIFAVALLLALETVCAQIVEPLIYSRSSGLHPLGVIVAAFFWSWLWGPLGLVVATPLTACLVVAGRYLPALRPLTVFFGAEGFLSPAMQLYHRTLSNDATVIDELIESEPDLLALADQIVLPALSLLKRDAQALASPEHAYTERLSVIERFIEKIGGLLNESPRPSAIEEWHSSSISRDHRILIAPLVSMEDSLFCSLIRACISALNGQALMLDPSLASGEMISLVNDTDVKFKTVVIAAVEPLNRLRLKATAKKISAGCPGAHLVISIAPNYERYDDIVADANPKLVADSLRRTIEILGQEIQRANLAHATATTNAQNAR